MCKEMNLIIRLDVKINSKWIIHLNVTPNIIKLLEKQKSRVTLCLVMSFQINVKSRVHTHTKNLISKNLTSAIKTCSTKDTDKRKKETNHRQYKNICKSHQIQDLYPEYIQNLNKKKREHNLKMGKRSTQILHQRRYMEDTWIANKLFFSLNLQKS